MINNFCGISILADELPIIILLANKYSLKIVELKPEKHPDWIRVWIEFRASLEDIKAFNEDLSANQERYMDAIDMVLK